MRINNIEYQWSETNQAHQIIEWREVNGKTYSFVVAFLRLNKEGVYFESVGMSHIMCEDQEALRIVTKHAMNFVQDKFDMENE